MKKVLVPAVFAALLLFAACGRAKPVLSLYTWSDYIKTDLVRRFERERGCRVVLDTFESNEAMYAKLKAGASGYDVLTPSSYMVSLMHDQGMLLRLDHGLLPNLAHVDPEYLKIAVDRHLVARRPEGLLPAGVLVFVAPSFGAAKRYPPFASVSAADGGSANRRTRLSWRAIVPAGRQAGNGVSGGGRGARRGPARRMPAVGRAREDAVVGG